MAAYPNLDEAVKLVENATGFTSDRPVAELHGWHYGERVRAIEDDDDNGIFAGDEGYLIIEEVGSPQHNNVRISTGFIADGYDSDNEVSLNNIEAVD